MDSTTLVAHLHATLPDVRVESGSGTDGQPTVYVAREDLLRVMRELRDRQALQFALLLELTATDYWPRQPRFEVVYLLVSIEQRLRMRVKVRVHGDDAHVPTVSGLWPAAGWLEREVWDLFGVVFDGHPDLRRLLMPDDWEGHPLRKDYPVQIHMKPVIAEPMQVTEEEFRANMERDRRARS